MKNIFKKALPLVIAGLLVAGLASAITVLYPERGGTGTSSVPAFGGMLAGDGTGVYGVQSVGSDGGLLFGKTNSSFGVAWSSDSLRWDPTTNILEVGSGSNITDIHSNEIDMSDGSNFATIANNGGLKGINFSNSTTGSINFNADGGSYIKQGQFGIAVDTSHFQALLDASLIIGSDKIFQFPNTAGILSTTTGTVTAVTVTTANGVSASVANQGTTPALTFTLGAITPTTVNGLTITANGTNILGITAGKTFNVTATLQLQGTDGTRFTFPAANDTVAALGTVETFTQTQTFDISTSHPSILLTNSASGLGNEVTFQDASGTTTSIFSPTGRYENTLGSACLTASLTNNTNSLATSGGQATDMTVTVVQGKRYIAHMVLFGSNSTALEGYQFDLGGGTATFTNLECGAVANAATGTPYTVYNVTSNTTAFTLAKGATTDTAYVVDCGFTVNAPGTIIPRFAENSIHATGTAGLSRNSCITTQESPN